LHLLPSISPPHPPPTLFPYTTLFRSSAAHDEGEEARRVQLIEVTIDSLAEVGYVGTTLAEIARRAGVSPGLVSHYFGDKDGLLEDRKSTRLNSSHRTISYAVFCLKKK